MTHTVTLLALLLAQDGVAPLPEKAKVVFTEEWQGERIDPEKWYVPRKKWGKDNHGVVPENVRIEEDDVRGRRKNVLVCEAHGDRYDGPVAGLWGKKTRVGGLVVSKPFFASGRFQVVMKIGSNRKHEGGPPDPTRPRGTVPSIWTYGYRFVRVDDANKGRFVAASPLYNPHMPRYGIAANEYWSELDFPEFGKDGVFTRAMYNTFCQNRHKPELFDVARAIDGKYHTFTTDWRTRLEPMEGVTDAQVVKHLGVWWIRDTAVPFDRYIGNPLKRLGPDRYALCTGERAVHWIDGRKVAENTQFVPAMAAQLNLGIWLPNWAGPADWKTSRISFASVKVWRFDDPGDVRGVLVDDIKDTFDKEGRELR